MTDEAKDAFEETLATIERMATKIAALPKEQQPEGLKIIREGLADAARELKLDGTRSDEFVIHMANAIEALVREIDARLGAGEGRA